MNFPHSSGISDPTVEARKGALLAAAVFPKLIAGVSLFGLLALAFFILYDPGVPPPKNPAEFHLFLLAGQSNMVGRARSKKNDGTSRQPNPRVLTLDASGKWRVAQDPIHFDDGAGIGLGTSFADAVAAANPDITIGLIPCAVGGTSIGAWEPGAVFEPTGAQVFDDAQRRIQKVLTQGTLKAILWHQGETDAANSDMAAAYKDRFLILVQRLREIAGDPELPLIIGELGSYLSALPDAPEALSRVREAHARIADGDPHISIVPSENLTDKGDGLHFDAKSQREFGRRFAAAYLKFER